MGIKHTVSGSSGDEKSAHEDAPNQFDPIPPQRLHEILDTSPVGVGIARVWDGTILYSNERIAEINGLLIHEIDGTSATDYWADPEEFKKCIEIYKTDGRILTLEAQLKRADGSQYPALTSWETIYLHDERCVLYWIYDLTDLKNTEAQLQLSESRSRKILEYSPIGVGISRLDNGEILYTNKRLIEDNRATKEVIGSSAMSSWVHTEEREEFLSIFSKDGRVPAREVLLLRQDNTEYPALLSWEGIDYDGEKCVLFWTYDITAMKEAEDKLLLTQAELARKEQVATLGQLEVINEIAEELHRSTDVMTVAKRATEVIQRYAGNPSAAISMLNEDNHTLDLLYTTDTRQPADREGIALPVDLSISGEAVTTQKVIACEDLESDERLHPTIKTALMEEFYVSSISIPLIYQDKTLGVMNLLFRELYIISERERETLGALGKTIGLAISNAIHVTQINQEIVERNTLEAQLQQAQKIESIGQLAGGIAHDFNNLLVVITGYSQMIQEDETLSDRGKMYAEEIGNAGSRAANLTRQLLTFGRRQAMNRASVNIDELLHSLQGMFSRLIPENIEQSLEIETDLPNIYGDPGHIEQVLVNLAVNARDAMPNGGTLKFRAELAELDYQFVKYHPGLSVGSHILIRVSDNGIGMSPDTIQKVYEPFYTTKPEGEGTGLGLSVVFGIVGRHDGHIHVVSDVGTGSEFRVYLPTTDLAAQEAKDTDTVTRKKRTETILLVEDDVQVREFAQKVLNHNGFTVLLAEDGESGIEQYETHHEHIDLIVSDVVMPNVGGRDMVERLLDKGFDVPVLFTSGYSPDSTHSDYLRRSGYTQIDKPYSPSALIEKVEEILKEAAR